MALTVAAALVVPAGATATGPSSKPLFADDAEAGAAGAAGPAAEGSQALEAGQARSRAVAVSQAELAGAFTSSEKVEPGEPVLVQLFDGETVELITTSLVAPQAEGASPDAAEAEWLGQVLDAEGKLRASASLVVHRDPDSGERSVSGLVQDGQRSIVVEPDGAGGHRMVELDEAGLPSFEDAVESAASGAEGDAAAAAAGGGPEGTAAVPPGGAEIRVLVAYANGVPGHTRTLVNTSIAWTNQALATSGVKAHLTLAGFVPANYAQGANPGQDREYLRSEGDGEMDQLHPLRDDLEADLVALVLPQPGSGICGAGFVPSATGSEHLGFSVSALGGCHYGLTFPHEIGHNLGANHDPPNVDPTNDGTFTYSRGHCVGGAVRDLMSYSSPCGGTRLLQLSSPLKPFVGYPWVPSGTAARDNARAVNQLVWPVSRYRQSGSAGNDYIWRGLSGRSFAEAHPPNQDLSHQPVAGDFDGDGHGDLFWYQPGEAPESVWYFDAQLDAEQVASSVGGTYEPLAGDFDGDGRHDVFWYRAGAGADYVWWGQSDRGALGTVQQPQPVNGTYTAFVGDFDGDGRDDVFWYRPGGDAEFIWWGQADRSRLGSVVTTTAVSGSYRPFTGDFDGDGFDDLFWYAPGTASDYLWWGRAERAAFRSPQSQISVSATYTPAVGDFDADSRDDIFWYRPGTASDFLWWGQADRGGLGSTQATPTVDGHYQPSVADFDGAHGEDIHWFVPG